MQNLYYTPMSPQRAELRKEWNGSGLDWDQYLKDAELKHQIESAKQFLKDNGYFVDNLWSVQDVKSKYECTDEQAQTVLGYILHGEWFISEVNASIDITAESYDLVKIENDDELFEEFEEGEQNRFRNNDFRSFEEWKEDKLND